MALQAMDEFAGWLAGEDRSDGLYELVQTLTGIDAGGGEFAVRLHVGKKSFYEARVDPSGTELQVGLGVESRVVNEAIEQMVLDSGEDLSELLCDELCDLGVPPLPMEHFFERPAFRYVVRLPLESPELLAEPLLRQRVKGLIQGCRILFQDTIDEA